MRYVLFLFFLYAVNASVYAKDVYPISGQSTFTVGQSLSGSGCVVSMDFDQFSPSFAFIKCQESNIPEGASTFNCGFGAIQAIVFSEQGVVTINNVFLTGVVLSDNTQGVDLQFFCSPLP